MAKKNKAEKQTKQEEEELKTSKEVNQENAENLEHQAEGGGDPVQLEKEKYLRLYSEFENFRRRTNKERIDWMQNASKDIIKELLTIIDDMERGIKALKDAGNESAVEGMELIYKKLFSTLEKKGLKPMTSVGEDFDSEIHEAVTQFAAPTPEMKGKVIDEIEKGYFLNDKVLRFAKVVVGN
ncbi:MAG: nucleotide exchange factor GrpE [Bacteroidia bacterium]